MNFIAVLRQGGGCDYTIGCGVEVVTLKATELEAARTELDVLITGYTDERRLRTAKLYGVVSTDLITEDGVNDIYRRNIERRQKLKKEQAEEAERRQLAALKAKYPENQ